MKYNYAHLSDVQKDFLKNYRPKVEGFTSCEEMNKIIEVLGLKGQVEDIRAMRNAVVRYYRPYISDYNCMDAMQSVTAVCDHVMYKIDRMAV